jgi:hypothetical protein
MINKNKNINEDKKIDLEMIEKEMDGKKGVEGRIKINYAGRFDSISINSQIEDSSDVFTYIEMDDKKINHPYARLSVFKKEIQNPEKAIKFKAFTNHIPKNTESNVKFRVTLIQEHKEIASDVKIVKINK